MGVFVRSENVEVTDSHNLGSVRNLCALVLCISYCDPTPS